MGDPLEILELRQAVAGAPESAIRDILELRLPSVAPPATPPEFDAWAWSLYDLGLAAETLPDPAAALDLYIRSIGCNRTSDLLRSAALVRSGLCLEQLGKWGEAMRAYESARESSFGWPDSRAILLYRLGRLQRAAGDPESALSSFGQLLELLPRPGIPDEEVSLESAACLEQTRRFEEARVRLVELSAKPHPASVDALVRLSALLIRLGDPDAAAAALRSLVSHPLADPAARSAAAIWLEQLGAH